MFMPIAFVRYGVPALFLFFPAVLAIVPIASAVVRAPGRSATRAGNVVGRLIQPGFDDALSIATGAPEFRILPAVAAGAR